MSSSSTCSSGGDGRSRCQRARRSSCRCMPLAQRYPGKCPSRRINYSIAAMVNGRIRQSNEYAIWEVQKSSHVGQTLLTAVVQGAWPARVSIRKADRSAAACLLIFRPHFFGRKIMSLSNPGCGLDVVSKFRASLVARPGSHRISMYHAGMASPDP